MVLLHTIMPLLKNEQLDMHPNMGCACVHYRTGTGTFSLLIPKALLYHLMHTGVVSAAGPTTATIPLEELYDLPGRDEGRGEGVYDLPSENGGVYSEVTRTEEPPPSPGEYAKFENPLYDTT